MSYFDFSTSLLSLAATFVCLLVCSSAITLSAGHHHLSGCFCRRHPSAAWLPVNASVQPALCGCLCTTASYRTSMSVAITIPRPGHFSPLAVTIRRSSPLVGCLGRALFGCLNQPVCRLADSVVSVSGDHHLPIVCLVNCRTTCPPTDCPANYWMSTRPVVEHLTN